MIQNPTTLSGSDVLIHSVSVLVKICRSGAYTQTRTRPEWWLSLCHGTNT